MTPSSHYSNKNKRRALWPAIGLVLLVTGCATPGGDRAAPARGAAAGMTAATGEIPDAVAKRYSDAQTLMSVEDYEGAVSVLEPVVELGPQYPGAATTLAIAYRNLDRHEDALALLETTLAVHDAYAPGWNEVGILHRESGRFGEAEAAYLKAVTVKPDYALAHFNFGILLDLYLGRHEQALEHYQRYQELVPDEDKQVSRWIADISRRIERNTRAARVAQ
ncbi:MAG: tetratricopeptide repeat protein [Pseudomonadota bacterium]